MTKVPQSVDAVNMPYHHGNLRETLVDVACGLAREGGPDAVVLRAVSREAGVSHNAAYRHFADRDDLLRAVCDRCMGRLAELMEHRIAELDLPSERADAAWARLHAAGQAYIDFALTEPGWFRTAFGVPRGTEPVLAEGGDPFAILLACLDNLVEVGEIAPERRPGAEYSAWAGVHGVSSLLIDGPLRDLPAAERSRAIDKVLEGIAAGLAATSSPHS
jgi:AcrR family transcriptional regulator